MTDQQKEFFDLLDITSLTNEELSIRFTVSRPTVERWKNRISSPQPLQLERIIKILKEIK